MRRTASFEQPLSEKNMQEDLEVTSDGV